MSALDVLDDEQIDPLFGDYPDVDERSCRLLGPTALIVQALMGVLVVLSLLYKRHREKPKRPWKIWMFDVSKQIAGQAFVHGINVLISDLAAHHSSKNPCVMYFLNILIDTTFGVGVIYLLIHITTHVLTDRLDLKGFRTGEYGDPPSFFYWTRQAVVYVFSLTTMKLLVVGLFAVWPGIVKIGAWLLSWTGGGDAAQVIVVMGLFPIIMNILQFWLIDSIVKASASTAVLPATSDPGDISDREPLFSARDSDGEDDDDAVVARRYDIENPRPRSQSSHSRPQSVASRKSLDNDERKYASSFTATPSAADAAAVDHLAHEYPPTSSSPDNSSVYSSGRESPRLFPSKRSNKRSLPPPPLQLSSASTSFGSSSIIAIGSTPLSGSRSTRATPSTSPSFDEKYLVHDRTASWHGVTQS
ncbi:hypothetical protein SCHPADRAFT_817456 [Schizopora paradoxa]|uniref:Uncharacterized protein n=1 Tax=Schizopora paradoxa TaxID=27342 RepID=A0A0H2S6L9_9AGAM|nr:hypothetical protein SCHPADRAFT_817456 [Schizopora paradoxa]